MNDEIKRVHGVEEKGDYEELEHTADWALRVRGQDFQTLLQNAALGMISLMGAVAKSDPGSQRWIELEAQDRESLLVTWLEELLFEMETRNVIVEVEDINLVSDTRLQARVVERPIAEMQKEIKAVTYHGLTISESAAGFEATVVFDV